jgi:hypothetical protein
MTACARQVEAPTTSRHQPLPVTASAQRPVTPQPPVATTRSTPIVAQSPRTCGPLGCRLFTTPEEAIETVLHSNPKVLAVGEAHAQRGTEHILSTARRFTETILPLLARRAKAIVVELPIADGSCGKAEQTAGRVAEQVTREQSASNPNEYMSLATRARALGIVPYPLRLGCEQYRQIAEAGAGDIASALTVIAQAMEREVVRRLAEHPNGLVVTYGGALHNDLHPDARHASWSFGPALSRMTHGAMVELDLIVREYIKDDEVWRALPWTAVFDPRAHTDSVVLYEPTPESFVLIFPVTTPGATKP